MFEQQKCCVVFVNGERLEAKGVTPVIEVPFEVEYAQGKIRRKRGR